MEQMEKLIRSCYVNAAVPPPRKGKAGTGSSVPAPGWEMTDAPPSKRGPIPVCTHRDQASG